MPVGEKLKKARLQKRVSLEQVYKQTKIHPRVLEALEQDRAHNFLSFIYIKAFLKTYARYLGLNEAELLKEYIDNQKSETPPARIVLERKDRAFPQINIFLIFRTVLVVLLIFILPFYFRHIWRTAFRSDRQTRIQKVEVKVVPPAEVSKTEKLVLQVRTKQDCWIRVKSDNKTIFEKTLPKGKSERWQAKEKIELLIGKPEALEVFLNGRPVDLKKAGVKKGLIITHTGIEGR